MYLGMLSHSAICINVYLLEICRETKMIRTVIVVKMEHIQYSFSTEVSM